jgi:DNA-directed RNA polymerase II subunit RPB3
MVSVSMSPFLELTLWTAEKAEWPLSTNAAFEQPPLPDEPFNYEAVPSTFYFNAEAVGSLPVRHVIEQGLDILTESLGRIILAVQAETGVDEDEEEGAGIVEPNLGGIGAVNGDSGYGGYGGGGAPWAGGGTGMSPLRR